MALGTALMLGGTATAQKVTFEEFDLDNGFQKKPRTMAGLLNCILKKYQAVAPFIFFFKFSSIASRNCSVNR